MKNLILALLFVATVSLGMVALHQRSQLAELNSQLAATGKQLKTAQSQQQSDAEERAARAEQKSRLFQDTLAKTTELADAKTRQADDLQKSLSSSKTNGGNPLAGMFKDPKMRDMIKNSQKLMMGPMLEKQYSALFQQLNLSADQTTTLKDLLQKKMEASMDSGMSMMDDSLTTEQRAAAAKQVQADKDGYDAQIKQFLGDDNYQAFQAYEKTTVDRMAASQFSDQLSGANAMTPDQQSQLVQAMSEERNNFKWTTDYSNPSTMSSGDMATLFSEDKIEQFTTEQERLDQQTLTRAKQILNPEQLTAFENYLTSRRQMQAAGMKMAANMFGKKSQ